MNKNPTSPSHFTITILSHTSQNSSVSLPGFLNSPKNQNHTQELVSYSLRRTLGCEGEFGTENGKCMSL